MARPRKPTNLLAINGAYSKNPARAKEREGEPEPSGGLGEPPVRWQPHPRAAEAAALFAEGKSTNDVAAALQVDWDEAASLRSAQAKAADNAMLCQLWREVAAMAPWLTSADRWTVESICELKLLERKGSIRPGERTELGRLAGKCGLNPSDRSRVNTFPGAPKKSERADPREEYMRRKQRVG